MLPQFLSDDHLDLLEQLDEQNVEYVLVGGVAVNYYGYNRSTGDVDIFFRRSADNIDRLLEALTLFFGDESFLPNRDVFDKSGAIIQFGVAPNRVDLLNDLSGVSFEEVWANRHLETLEHFDDLQIPIIDLGELLENKRASGRPKDRADFEYLRELPDE